MVLSNLCNKPLEIYVHIIHDYPPIPLAKQHKVTHKYMFILHTSIIIIMKGNMNNSLTLYQNYPSLLNDTSQSTRAFARVRVINVLCITVQHI